MQNSKEQKQKSCSFFSHSQINFEELKNSKKNSKEERVHEMKSIDIIQQRRGRKIFLV